MSEVSRSIIMTEIPSTRYKKILLTFFFIFVLCVLSIFANYKLYLENKSLNSDLTQTKQDLVTQTQKYQELNVRVNTLQEIQSQLNEKYNIIQNDVNKIN